MSMADMGSVAINLEHAAGGHGKKPLARLEHGQRAQQASHIQQVVAFSGLSVMARLV
jgi:hypothetical protein